MNRGDIVLITFPFSDLTATKVRPALVLSPISPKEQDYIVALISSNIERSLSNTDYLLLKSDSAFAETGLKVESVFRMAKLHNLNKSLAKRKIGKVDSNLMQNLETKLRLALGL